MSKQSGVFMKNSSGYMDPAAYAATKHIDKDKARVSKLVSVIRYMCDLSGFEMGERIVLVDKGNGQVWR